jgi:hypothetical protein
LERHFLLFLKRVADSELVGCPDHVRTHENVFRQVGCYWEFRHRDLFDEGTYEDAEMYLI